MPSDKNTFLRVLLGTGPQADITQQVVRVDVQDEDRGTDKATVTMGDQAHVNAEAILGGTEVRIEMGWESENSLLFIGYVQPSESTSPAGGGAPGRLTFTAHDPSTLMSKPPKEQNRQHVGSLAEIVEAIAKRNGIPLGAVTIDPMPSWSKEAPLLQRNRSDWQLIQDLAEENRARAFVEVNSTPSDTPEQRKAGGLALLYVVSEASLLAQEPMGRLNYCRGFSSLIEFKFKRIGTGASPSATLATVDPATGAVGRETAPPHAPDAKAALAPWQVEGAEAALGASRAQGMASAVDFANAQPRTPSSMRPVIEIAGGSPDPVRARRLIQQDPTRLLGLHGQGLAMGTVHLRAKGSVELEGLASTASGRWYVRRVNHLYERDDQGFRTRRTYRTSFEATR